MVFKSPYHQELQKNGRGSRMNYERQDTTLAEKVEKTTETTRLFSQVAYIFLVPHNISKLNPFGHPTAWPPPEFS